MAKNDGGVDTGQRKQVSIPSERSGSVVINTCESISSRILSSDIRTVNGGGGVDVERAQKKNSPPPGKDAPPPPVPGAQ